MREKFSYKGRPFNSSNFKSEFILSCLRTRDISSVAWAKEMKMMTKLVKTFSSDPLFWYHARPTFFIPSLAWFFKSNGKAFLAKKKREFDLNAFQALRLAEEEYMKMSAKKIGENLEQKGDKKIIKSLKEWLISNKET